MVFGILDFVCHNIMMLLRHIYYHSEIAGIRDLPGKDIHV